MDRKASLNPQITCSTCGSQSSVTGREGWNEPWKDAVDEGTGVSGVTERAQRGQSHVGVMADRPAGSLR